MARSIHPKSRFKSDMTYIRTCLSQAADSMDRADWSNLQLIFQEISGIACNLEALAIENRLEIKDAQFMDEWEIKQILEAREAEKS